MLVNINYKGKIVESLKGFKFGDWKPQQYVYRCKDYTIVIFKSGSCRIMGCKKILDESKLPFKIIVNGIQSITTSIDLRRRINLNKLAKELNNNCYFDPETFPALRMTAFNPLCVNVFASGKVVIMGIKTLDYNDLVNRILLNITV